MNADIDDDDNYNHTSLMTSNEGDLLRATIAIAMTATMHAHQQQQRVSIGDGNETASCDAATRQKAEAARREARWLEDESRRRRNKWGVASCNNQMAKKRSRQSCEVELVAARQQGRRDNQLANKRQMGGEAYKRQTGGEASADKRRRSNQRKRGGGSMTGGIATTSQRRQQSLLLRLRLLPPPPGWRHPSRDP